MADKAIGVGDVAPDFTLSAQTGEQITLSDYRGDKVVVLYFYPKDETRGCTAEACAFRDSYEEFAQAGAQVIGVSSDSVDSHDRFARKYDLPFVLVADAGGEVRKNYGIPSTLGILPGRFTYVIDRDGVVQHVFTSMVNIGKHINSALDVVKSLNQQARA